MLWGFSLSSQHRALGGGYLGAAKWYESCAGSAFCKGALMLCLQAITPPWFIPEMSF